MLRREKSPECEFCGSGARKGDLLEIEYTGKLEDGTVFDGSSIKVGGGRPGGVGSVPVSMNGGDVHALARRSYKQKRRRRNEKGRF